jgi:hypothetical protein
MSLMIRYGLNLCIVPLFAPLPRGLISSYMHLIPVLSPRPITYHTRCRIIAISCLMQCMTSFKVFCPTKCFVRKYYYLMLSLSSILLFVRFLLQFASIIVSAYTILSA